MDENASTVLVLIVTVTVTAIIDRTTMTTIIVIVPLTHWFRLNLPLLRCLAAVSSVVFIIIVIDCQCIPYASLLVFVLVLVRVYGFSQCHIPGRYQLLYLVHGRPEVGRS